MLIFMIGLISFIK